MPMMASPTYPYMSANLGLYRVIRRSRVKTIPTEAFCMIASISRRVLRKVSSVRAPPASWMSSSADFLGGRTAMSARAYGPGVFLSKRARQQALVQIPHERRRASLGIRQRHVAVGAHEIHRVTPESRSLDLRPPRKDVQSQFPLATRCLDLRRDLAIDVDLPRQSAQRREVVVALHPRQPVPAVHAAAPAYA